MCDFGCKCLILHLKFIFLSQRKQKISVIYIQTFSFKSDFFKLSLYKKNIKTTLLEDYVNFVESTKKKHTLK